MLVLNDQNGFRLVERATYCKVGDEKRPQVVGLPSPYFTVVQMCPEDLGMGATQITNALPASWHARIMFDELLDPNIEELIPVLDPDTNQPDGTYIGTLANTQPVELSCDGVAVAYDGYYSPSGNAVTWPVGPSLVIEPLDHSLVATGAECQVTLKPGIVDKDGVEVPAEDLGPHTWRIGALELVATDPEPADPGEEATIVPESPAFLFFNHSIDAASLTPAEVSILEVADCAATTGTAQTAVVAPDPEDPTAITISMAGAAAGLAWNAESFFQITFAAGAEVADTAGGTLALPEAADFTLCFGTDMVQP